MFEYHLKKFTTNLTANGARYPSYNTIVGSGEKRLYPALHRKRCEMRDVDLVLIDALAMRYAGDMITRTSGQRHYPGPA